MRPSHRSALLLAALFGLAGSTALAQPVVERPVRANTSRPLREIVRERPTPPVYLAPFAIPNKFKMGVPRLQQPENVQDPIVQSQQGPLAPATVGPNFDGSNDDDNSAVLGYRVVPPDTDGDVGPSHYVQWINSVSEIFNKSGVSILGPFAGNLYFQGMGGKCDSRNDGDPIVLYDEAADRWLVSQFALGGSPYYMCVAISQTSDPTGAYHQYAFSFGTDFPDYPKLGIWGDSYTMTTRDFPNGAFWGGISAVALDRAAMLAGQPATMVRFRNAFASIGDGALPADADGPVTGPALFGAHGDDGDTTFELWELDVNWSNPSAATFSAIPGVTISAYDGSLPGINQPNGQSLDNLAWFTMHRLNVRDFGTHRSMVANHTVETTPGTAGIRWYEFRNTGGNWFNYQEGTYSPNTDDRWMGSIAINANGSIALGYSRSSSSMFPSIYFTGQTPDQSGTGVMNVAETLVHAGGGSQSGASRWGDYSAMSVDPSDNRSFWFTTEYYAATASFDFNTRIARLDLGDAAIDMPPVVSITTPADGSSFQEGTNIVFEATASDDIDIPFGGVIEWTIDGASAGSGPLIARSDLALGSHTVVASATDSKGNTGSDQITVTVTPPAGSTMHVALITTGSISAGKGSKYGTAQVTMVDGAGSPRANVDVQGFFGPSYNETASSTTNSSGIASFQTRGTAKGGVTFCVQAATDQASSGPLTYDPTANADPAYACDGGGGDPGTGTELHVVSVVTGSTGAGRGQRSGTAAVTVQDENNAVVAGALVTGTFSGDVTGGGSGTTGLDGIANVVSDGTTSVKRPQVGFCVTNVALDGYSFVPGGSDCSAQPALAQASGKHAADSRFSGVPTEFALDQNYPNPFNPSTVIQFAVPEAGPVSIKVFDLTGKEVKTLLERSLEAGTHLAGFDAGGLSAGVYLYVMRAGDFVQTRRMTLLK